ncbi:hypothetical protein KC19_10G159100 [Ceratodon purpureus]|uniref:Uncharacterized protein n=1 Tax=Ceratodon purpureus TaxID=3225 RepID=A0A8T0GR52_CERPU|nr:hypothetical protein KC19_10G159100 [Ceratodon purpureus]
MEPFGVLPRWLVVLRLIDVTIAVLSILLTNYWSLIKDGVILFNLTGIGYLVCGIVPLRLLTRRLKADQKELLLTNLRVISFGTIGSMVNLSFLVKSVIQESSKYQSFPSKESRASKESFASKDGCEGCYSVIQACFGVMVLLKCLQIIVSSMIPADDPSRSGDIQLMVGNSRMRVHLGLFGGLSSVLIRCGRVVGGVDGLVAWRIGLGSMGAMILTFVLGGFGSVMTANVLRTCWWLGFLETILVCASQENMLDMCMRARYVVFSALKIGLVIFSIMNNNLHSLTESSGCKVGSACYSRLRECFWVMLVIYFLEVFLAILLLLVHHQRQGSNILANSYGVFLSMSSALSITQVASVGLLLGGSYGPLMTARGFWLCAITGIVEMAALMGITDWVGKVIKTEIDTGMSFSNNISLFFIVPALRMCGLFIIVALIDVARRNGENFFIADMSNCDETCQTRGRDLFSICQLTISLQANLSLLSVCSILIPPRALFHRENRQLVIDQPTEIDVQPLELECLRIFSG